jgi:hypothetical protein
MRRRLRSWLIVAALFASSLAVAAQTASSPAGRDVAATAHRPARAVEPFAVATRTMHFVPAPDDSDSDHDKWAAGSIKMPFVTGGAAGVADRINTVLYLEELNLAPPPAPGADFTPPRDHLPEGIRGIEFEVDRNDPAVLSIVLTLFQCGHPCTEQSAAFHFDARTGQRLWLHELLTPQGGKALVRKRSQAGMAVYAQALAQLPPLPEPKDDDGDTAAAPSPAIDPAADPNEPGSDERREFLEGCRAMWEHDDRLSDAQVDFALPPGGLDLDMTACAASTRQRRMDVLPQPIHLGADELEPWLSDYGRNIVLGRGTASRPIDPVGQVLRGRVGGALVTMYLRQAADGKPDGLYFYERHRVPITLYADPKLPALELRENGDTGFTLNREGARLVGTWHGKGKTLPVRLE